MNFEIRRIFRIFDLGWPLFWKADFKRVILIYNLPIFNELWNFTLNDSKFEIRLQTKIFVLKLCLGLTDHFELEALA